MADIIDKKDTMEMALPSALTLSSILTPMSTSTSIVVERHEEQCCRLCLAPKTECVSIFTTPAADKEIMSSKIQACVNIKVLESDKLSSRICHMCISYLNSWQAFKNRCHDAQRKQRTWLGIALAEKRKDAAAVTTSTAATAGAGGGSYMADNVSLLHTPTAALTSEQAAAAAAGQATHQLVGPKSTSLPLDTSFIKQEPEFSDAESDDSNKMQMEIDPTQFLAGADYDDETGGGGGGGGVVGGLLNATVQSAVHTVGDMPHHNESPSILTSLGLTHINNTADVDLGVEEDVLGGGTPLQQANRRRQNYIPANCTVCNMRFSNRANARRHERNIHGIAINPANQSQNNLQTSSTSASAPATPASTTATGAAAATANSTIAAMGSSPQQKSLLLSSLTAARQELFDYKNPSKYRHLLTDHKILFMRRHNEFLAQYQTMHCKCCDKTYSTYKMFMSHMRKKYETLPRNMCFRCMKQFQSKGQFIAHLKKKNCLNAFRVYQTDATIAKDAKALEIAAKSGTGTGPKDLLANKAYGCKLCPERFRLKIDFRSHIYESHTDDQQKQVASIPGRVTPCAFCGAQFEEALARRRHYNNLECIIFLVCGTCDERFDSHAAFTDHVYAAHLSGKVPALVTGTPTAGTGTTTTASQSLTADGVGVGVGVSSMTNGSSASAVDESLLEDADSSSGNLRHPQNCFVCGKQYNNYYNVLRHMESKHPDQLPNTYQCEICATGFPRQTALREHMKDAHGEITLTKIPSKNQSSGGGAGVGGGVGSSLNCTADGDDDDQPFTCRECGALHDSHEEWLEHLASHEKYRCTECDHVTANRNDFVDHLTTHLSEVEFSCTLCRRTFNTDKGLQAHVIIAHSAGVKDVAGEDGVKQKECPICHAVFNLGVGLSNHMRTHVSSNGPASHAGQKMTLSAASAAVGALSSRMRCRICQKRINTRVGYRRHLLFAHNIRNCKFVSCDLCPAEFSNRKGLRVHMYRAHQITVGKNETCGTETTDCTLDQQFECDICHTVYRSRVQLRDHSMTVHGFDNSGTDKEAPAAGAGAGAVETSTTTGTPAKTTSTALAGPPPLAPMTPSVPGQVVPEMWFQCRYCSEMFNANKKLTIHMNSHEEHDQTDNTCKDCGNVYMTRKSLWVHRHKKHPRATDPSPCEICRKVFFDKTEHYHHIKTHAMEFGTDNDQDGVAGSGGTATLGGGREMFSCHVCGQKFQDKGPLSKHLRIHEMQNNMFSNPSLAAVVAAAAAAPPMGGDTKDGNHNHDQDSSSGGGGSGGGGGGGGSGGGGGGGTVARYPYRSEMVNGKYVCDMCPKTFSVLSALKVHRGWHFRSPDGRHVTDPSNLWQPDTLPPSRIRRSRGNPNNPPICPYCKSKFASMNNLRRHIVEVHKRNETKLLRDKDGGSSLPNAAAVNAQSAAIKIEREGECRACAVTFKTRAEWLEHKIMHARTQKPSTTFEWGCEICGKVFTRKERLLQHMVTHLAGGGDGNSVADDDEQNDTRGHEDVDDDVEEDVDEDDLEEDDDDEDDDDQGEGGSTASNGDRSSVSSGSVQEVEMMEEEIMVTPATAFVGQPGGGGGQYSCDLCQVFFGSAKELRLHVSAHFLNGDTDPVVMPVPAVPQLAAAPTLPSPLPLATAKPTTTVPVFVSSVSDSSSSSESSESEEEDEEEEEQEEQEEEQEEQEEEDRPHEQEQMQVQVLDEDNDDDIDDDIEMDDGGGDDDDDDGEDDDDEDDEEDGNEEEDDNMTTDSEKMFQTNPKSTSSSSSTAASTTKTTTTKSTATVATANYKCRLCSIVHADHSTMVQCYDSHQAVTGMQCTKCNLYFGDAIHQMEHDIVVHPQGFIV